jgi:hypothetical protein
MTLFRHPQVPLYAATAARARLSKMQKQVSFLF